MLPWGPRVPVGGRGARALLPAPRSSLSSGTMDTISEVVQRARAAFNAGKTRPLQCRVQQLEGLRRLIREREKDLVGALAADLRKVRPDRPRAGEGCVRPGRGLRAARRALRPALDSPQNTPGASRPFYRGESAAAQTGRTGFSLRPAAPQVPSARSVIPPPGFTPFSTQPSTRGHPFPASSFFHLSAPCGPGSPHQGTAQPGFAEGSLLCWASSLPPSPSSPTPGQNQTPPNTQPLPLAAPKSLGPASTLPSAWPWRRAEGLWSPSPYRFLAFCRCFFFFFKSLKISRLTAKNKGKKTQC